MTHFAQGLIPSLLLAKLRHSATALNKGHTLSVEERIYTYHSNLFLIALSDRYLTQLDIRGHQEHISRQAEYEQSMYIMYLLII